MKLNHKDMLKKANHPPNSFMGLGLISPDYLVSIYLYTLFNFTLRYSYNTIKSCPLQLFHQMVQNKK